MIPLFYTLSYFNSHAHVERDSAPLTSVLVSSPISTHTLTWSVTYSLILPIAYLKISTHTLTWSVTMEIIK